MHKSQIVLLTAIVAMSPLAFANDVAATGQEASDKTDMMTFSELDKDQDGQLTKVELPASSMHSKHFAKIDADSDGSLSKAEVDKHLVEDMGMSPDPAKKMDHGDMDGMEGDMKDMDHGEMPMDTDDDN